MSPMGKPAISRPAPAVGYADGPEEFLWDGLALVRRGDKGYLNEPHANGGSPILSSDGALLFNDLLGSTLGTLGGDGYRPCSLTAFGDTEDAGAFFTGKPRVDGLGYAFLLRNYRPDHGKWLTADPLGYPDGWNRLAYCNNQCDLSFDFLGAIEELVTIQLDLKDIEPLVLSEELVRTYAVQGQVWGVYSQEIRNRQELTTALCRKVLNSTILLWVSETSNSISIVCGVGAAFSTMASIYVGGSTLPTAAVLGSISGVSHLIAYLTERQYEYSYEIISSHTEIINVDITTRTIARRLE